MANTKSRFLWAVGQQESGGNYRAVNPGSGALGRWQVMPSNVPGWTREAIGYSVDSSTFLYNDWVQNAVANKILGGYYDRYGPAGAAAVWYCGQPTPNATFGDPPVYRYVNDVLHLMGEAPNAGQGAGQTTSYPNALSDVPSWSIYIQQSSDQFETAGRIMGQAATAIRGVRSRLG
jgi:Transglycosylase SLT domain